MANNKLCYIGNKAARYRESVFCAIDAEYDCEWYFSLNKSDIKEMDLSLLKKVTKYPILGSPSKLYWKRKVLRLLLRKDLHTFLALSESRCITDYVFFALAKLLKKDVYVWTHGWYGKETKTEAFLKLRQFNLVKGIFVYSNYARQLMIEQGIPENKIFTIHNSLHYCQQKALRESISPSPIYQEHFGNVNPTIVFIGRLTKVKKLDMVIDAIQMLKDRGENYNFVLVGDGEERNNLERKVAENGLRNNVWFYGACYDEKQNAELLFNADLCVSPGNVGLTAMHALVFGCPVITHNCFKWQMPEFEAIHAGETGDFFEMDDVASLAKTISQWFACKSACRDEVRQACYKEIDESWTPEFQMKVIRENLKI